MDWVYSNKKNPQLPQAAQGHTSLANRQQIVHLQQTIHLRNFATSTSCQTDKPSGVLFKTSISQKNIHIAWLQTMLHVAAK